MHVQLRRLPGGRSVARMTVRGPSGATYTVGADGDDWIHATALAAQEMLQMRRAKLINMRAPQAKKLAAVALLASPTIRAAVQNGMTAQAQAIEAVKDAAIAQGVPVARALASKAEDIAGTALKEVTKSLPGGELAYNAGVQVWRQVKKIPFLSKLFG